MATTFNVFFLGTAADLDPTEGNVSVENASMLTGVTFGSIADPLFDHVQSLSPGTGGFAGGEAARYDTDNLSSSENFQLDGGPVQVFDSVFIYDSTLTYTDGTTATIRTVLFQDTAGNIYLAPQSSQIPDQDAMEAKPIRSLTLDTYQFDSSGLEADRAVGSYLQPDGTVEGTVGDDMMGDGYTDAQGDTIGTGNDVIEGGAGNDSIDAGLGDDTVFGGDGNDILLGGVGDDRLYGGNGNDVLQGGADDDVIHGGAGTDSLSGGDGTDIAAFGGSYTDYTYAIDGSGNATVTLIATGDVTTLTGFEQISFDTEGQFDLVVGSNAGEVLGPPDTDPVFFISGNGADGVGGGSAADVIIGGDDTDNAGGGVGNDTFFGGAGADFAGGDAGDDVLYGGLGDDGMGGGDNNDSLYGGDGNDGLGGDAGDDFVAGGAGNDTIAGNDGNDTLVGDTGSDTLYGDAGNDTLFGGNSNDTIFGGDGNDYIDVGVNSDTGYGGAGDDYLIDASTGGGAATLYGGSGNDTIVSGTGNAPAVYDGGDGDDLLQDRGNTNSNQSWFGGAGDDRFELAGGNDSAYGGADVDTFIVQAGADSDLIEGGETGDDNDVLIVEAGSIVTYGGGNDEAGTIALASGGTTTFSEIENIRFEGAVDGTAGDDTMLSGFVDSEGDTIDGADGDDDLIFGYAGNDTLNGSTGNDSLYAGDGDDLIYAGEGNDLSYGGAGNDRFTEGDSRGNDTLFGDDGADTFDVRTTFGAFGTDTIYGGEGAIDDDTILLDSMATAITVNYFDDEEGTISDGGGNTIAFSQIERLTLTDSHDELYAGADGAGLIVEANGGNDTLWGGSGADSLNGGAGNDEIFGDSGDDLILGDAGNDNLGGDAGNDTVIGDAGADYMQGGAGNDRLDGGADDDTLIGGTGDDTFVFGRAGGNDLVTDFDIGDDDTDGFYNDQLDVSALRTLGGDPVTRNDVTPVDIGGGNVRLDFPEGESITLQGVSFAQMSSPAQLYAAGIPCFTAGTLIATPGGQVAVEKLRPGDRVVTRDNGFQAIAWVGQRTLNRKELLAMPKLRPIQVAAGTFGNETPVLFSPQHGLLLRDKGGGVPEQFVRARHLARIKGGKVREAHGIASVTYVHLMFEAHQVIMSAGLWTESFYPGPQAMAALRQEDVDELNQLFPTLRTENGVSGYGAKAREFTAGNGLAPHLSALTPVAG